MLPMLPYALLCAGTALAHPFLAAPRTEGSSLNFQVVNTRGELTAATLDIRRSAAKVDLRIEIASGAHAGQVVIGSWSSDGRGRTWLGSQPLGYQPVASRDVDRRMAAYGVSLTEVLAITAPRFMPGGWMDTGSTLRGPTTTQGCTPELYFLHSGLPLPSAATLCASGNLSDREVVFSAPWLADGTVPTIMTVRGADEAWTYRWTVDASERWRDDERFKPAS